jgi:DNA-binding CsgD family transcriptional regulator
MMSLATLGLTPPQERLYRHLLRATHTDLDTAATELRIPDIRRVAGELRTLGLIDQTLNAVTPTTAVDLLVRRRIEQTQRQLTELTVAWDVLTELAEEHRSGRPVQMVEHLPDGPAVTRRMFAVLADHPGEFVHLKAKALFSGTQYAAAPFKGFLARGLYSRTLFSADALADPEQEPYARSWQKLGDLHRITTEPFRHLAVVNRAAAYVQADPADPTAGALQIRQPGAVAMLAEVFDGMWDRARDLDDLPLTPIEQHVLHALVSHDTDAAAARSLSVSVRKFRTHVADLMARLGAATRFQAALRAKQRGWL